MISRRHLIQCAPGLREIKRRAICGGMAAG
jgi:hypothetical protein